MGGLFSSGLPEHQVVLHNVYLRGPMAETSFVAVTEATGGFYPKQCNLGVSLGHSIFANLITAIIDCYKLDREKIGALYWTAWVAKHETTINGDDGETLKSVYKIINDATESDVLARYIMNPEWDFYFGLEVDNTTGFLGNSVTPPTEYLMPSEMRN